MSNHSKPTAVRVEPATSVDLSDVRLAYSDGRVIQREQGSAVWPHFTDAAILSEIEAGLLFRVMAGDVLAAVFSVAYQDAAIWGERERGAHIYLHRIARASGYHGRGIIDTVLTWAHTQCVALGRDGLRMDTWATNAALIKYYRQLGFELVGTRRIVADRRLPEHYHGIDLALLERPCTVNVEHLK